MCSAGENALRTGRGIGRGGHEHPASIPRDDGAGSGGVDGGRPAGGTGGGGGAAHSAGRGGFGFLPLYLMQKYALIENYAGEAGVKVTVNWSNIGGRP